MGRSPAPSRGTFTLEASRGSDTYVSEALGITCRPDSGAMHLEFHVQSRFQFGFGCVQMVAEVVKAQHLSDLQKATILHELGAKEFAVIQGAD